MSAGGDRYSETATARRLVAAEDALSVVLAFDDDVLSAAEVRLIDEVRSILAAHRGVTL